MSDHPAVVKLREIIADKQLAADIDAIGLDVATSYTLADAMREGASVTRQLHGDFVNEHSACGIGAAYLAARARGYIK